VAPLRGRDGPKQHRWTLPAVLVSCEARWAELPRPGGRASIARHRRRKKINGRRRIAPLQT
jgi:hypothetical protein